PADKCRALLLAIIFPCTIAGAVLEVGTKDLISRLQRKRFCDDIDAIGRVGHIDEIIRMAAYILRQRSPGLQQVSRTVDIDKLDRFCFQLSLPTLIVLKDGERTGPERAEIQVGDLGIEEKGRWRDR